MQSGTLKGDTNLQLGGGGMGRKHKSVLPTGTILSLVCTTTNNKFSQY